jgi:hypothetical protein
MPEASLLCPAIYQLRVVLCGVSPLVWRRLLVASETSLAKLHEILQTAFDWSGEHLHRFLIHGAAYGMRKDRFGFRRVGDQSNRKQTDGEETTDGMESAWSTSSPADTNPGA